MGTHTYQHVVTAARRLVAAVRRDVPWCMHFPSTACDSRLRASCSRQAYDEMLENVYSPRPVSPRSAPSTGFQSVSNRLFVPQHNNSTAVVHAINVSFPSCVQQACHCCVYPLVVPSCPPHDCTHKYIRGTLFLFVSAALSGRSTKE